MTHPREIQWFLCKFIPDPFRNEPRNIGLIYRPADGPLKTRFLDPNHLPAWVAGDGARYRERTTKWLATIEKHGSKCLHWLPKRKNQEPYYIEFAGARFVTGDADFDAMFKELVE
jgi:hypothetical protein